MIVLAALLAGCGGSIHIPANLRTPTVAGVVQEATQLPNDHWQIQLLNGQMLEIAFDQTTSLLGGPQVAGCSSPGMTPTGANGWPAYH